jgi:predicted DNA-binding ribbon-helix-helix protein
LRPPDKKYCCAKQKQIIAAQPDARNQWIARSASSNGDTTMKSQVVKRSIVIAGHKTSVSLEDAFWNGLKEIAASRDMPLSDLVAAIDSARHHGNLSSAIRLYVLGFYRDQVVEHEKRGRTRDMLTTIPSSKPRA